MRNSKSFIFIMLCLLLSAILTFSACKKDSESSVTNDTSSGDTTVTKANFGVVALSTVGSICIIDGKNMTISDPLLTSQFGSYGGGLFDVVITPDGKTTLVTNFGDSKVFFVDTSNPSSPSVSGDLEIGFFAEDMAVTPNGRYLLVTNGGFANRIAVVDIASQDLVTNKAPEANLYHNCVAVSPDGRTVITGDYFQGRINVFTLNTLGHLEHQESIDVMGDGGKYGRPVNMEISPDGKTIIVANASGDNGKLVFPVLKIKSPGHVELDEMVESNENLNGAQSIVFNKEGTRAYLHCTQTYVSGPVSPDNVIVELKKDSFGWKMNEMFNIGQYGTSQLFGVDTLAIDNDTGYLWISNPTLSGGQPYLQVLDVKKGKIIEKIDIHPVLIQDSTPHFISIPTGITFWNP